MDLTLQISVVVFLWVVSLTIVYKTVNDKLEEIKRRDNKKEMNRMFERLTSTQEDENTNHFPDPTAGRVN